ncbi:lipopolysaccharide biosynthesis protein [Phocaeicola sp.]
MGISLYTSRIILATLGVTDYGIYNVVGGIVTMLSFLTGAMSSATQRFLLVKLGVNDKEGLKTTFHSALYIHFIIAIIVLFIAETVGLWFLNTQMNIPDNRMLASNWIYQCTVFSFAISMFFVPYNASIVSHENMGAFAYISIFDAIAKLCIVFLIAVINFDHLIVYALLLLFVGLISNLLYVIYAKIHFEECTLRFSKDKEYFKSIMNLAGWNLIGNLAFIAKSQGVNILINIFCGPTINAARGLGFQVNQAVTSFVQNFQTALNPQITKSYAKKDKMYLNTLIFNGSSYSFYLMLILSLPILMNTHFILSLWLVSVPDYSVEFVQLAIILSLCDVLYGPLLTAHLATGNIKNLQIMVGLVNLLNLPISYLFLELGFNVLSTMWVAIIISIITLILRIYCYKQVEDFSAVEYLKKVLLKAAIISAFATILPLLFTLVHFRGWNYFLISCTICVINAGLAVFYIGLDEKSKAFIFEKIKIKKSYA